MTPLIVLHVIKDLKSGGAARSMCAIAASSARLGGFRHRVVSLNESAPGMLGLAQAAGLEILNGPTTATLAEAISEADLTVLHFWNAPEVYDFLRAQLPPMRLIIWSHIAGDSPPQVITPALLKAADCFVASSPYSLELPVLADAATRRGMIWSSADFSRLTGITRQPHEGFNIGYLGTVDFVKMRSNFISLCARINVPNAKFLVAGTGGAEATLRRQAERAGIKDRFEWLGYVEDLRQVLEVLDVFGYPLCEGNYSTAELVLQEAMYAGVPPVIFACGGAQRTVLHGETGLIVRNDAEYAEAVEFLFRHPEKRQQLGRNAQDYARRHFGAERAAAAFNELFSQTLSIAPRPGPRLMDAWTTAAGNHSRGAAAFVRSLGETAPYFAQSLRGEKPAEWLAADDLISRITPVEWDCLWTYRTHYPDDAHLRLWTGLSLRRQGRPVLALAELKKAQDVGLAGWRAAWHMAGAAEEAGAIRLAKDHLEVVLHAAPDFAAAREMESRLSTDGVGGGR